MTTPGTHWAVKGLFWLALIWFVKSAETLLAPVAVSVVLAFLLGPGVRALRRRGVPVAAGAVIMVGSLLLLLALIAGTVAAPATQWWERAPTLVGEVLRRVERLRAAIPLAVPRAHPAATGGGAPGQTSPPASTASATVVNAPRADAVSDRIASEGLALTSALVGNTVVFLARAFGSVLLLFFLLVSEHWIVSRIVEAFPRQRQRAIVLSGLRSAQRDISRFFGSLGLLYAGVGLATALGLAVLGVPNPLLWGVLTALLNFLPYFGPVVITAMLSLAGLGHFGFEPAASAPPLLFILLHMIEANFLSPWFIAQRLLLSPVAVFLSVLFWGWAWGITGALIAVPVLVGLGTVCRRHRRLRLLHLLMQGSRAKPPSLRSLLRKRAVAAERPT